MKFTWLFSVLILSTVSLTPSRANYGDSVREGPKSGSEILASVAHLVHPILDPHNIPLTREGLKKALVHPSFFVKQTGVTVLGMIGTREDIPVLMPLLNDRDPSIAVETIRSIYRLSTLEQQQCPLELEKNLRTRAKEILGQKDDILSRLGAAIVLTNMGDTAGTDVVLQELQEGPLGNMAAYIVPQLIKIHSENSVKEKLLSALASRLSDERQTELNKNSAAYLLGSTGLPRAKEILRAHLATEKSPAVRSRIQYILDTQFPKKDPSSD